MFVIIEYGVNIGTVGEIIKNSVKYQVEEMTGLEVGSVTVNAVSYTHLGVKEAASIGIIGGADGPTAIYVTKTLAPALLPAIAIAAYSYMALIPVIQPPIMKLMTTKKERQIVMEQLRPCLLYTSRCV